MKATGIVRRIDDLGRVVIPKEIRRKMRISEGDPMEIFLDNDTVCFKKYDENETYFETISKLRNDISSEYGNPMREQLLSKLDDVLNVLKPQQ